MAAHCMVSPYRVAVVPGTSSRRGVSFRSYNTRIDTGTDTAEKSLEAVLLDVGIEASVLGSVKQVGSLQLQLEVADNYTHGHWVLQSPLAIMCIRTVLQRSLSRLKLLPCLL